MKRLAVYCGSATPADPIYIETARHVGRTLAERGIGVVYGGGRLGLMGAVADSALEAGGEVIGIIPDALVGAEVAHRGVTELHVVSGMHGRKKMFPDLSDGFLTIPGGVGPQDELWEAISWGIGRASRRERVCQSVYMSVGAVSLKQKNTNIERRLTSNIGQINQ